MTLRIELPELLSALEFADMHEIQGGAYIDRETGAIHITADGAEGELPDDIEDPRRFLTVPDRRQLDLGRNVLFDFIKQRLPADYDTVAGYFDRKGGYRRTKTLLEARGALEAWHRFEERADEDALREWCAEHDIDIIDTRPA